MYLLLRKLEEELSFELQAITVHYHLASVHLGWKCIKQDLFSRLMSQRDLDRTFV